MLPQQRGNQSEREEEIQKRHHCKPIVFWRKPKCQHCKPTQKLAVHPHWTANMEKTRQKRPRTRWSATWQTRFVQRIPSWRAPPQSGKPNHLGFRLSIAHHFLSTFLAAGFQLRARHVRHEAVHCLRVALHAQVLMRVANNSLPKNFVPTIITTLFFVIASVSTWPSFVCLLHGYGHRDVLLSFFRNGDGDGRDNDGAVKRAAEPELHGMGDLVQGQREGSSVHSRLIATRVVEACSASSASGVRIVGIFRWGSWGNRSISLPSLRPRAATTHAAASAKHTVVNHGGKRSREWVRASWRGIIRGILHSGIRMMEDRSWIAENCLGMVVTIARIKITDNPTASPCAGSLNRLCHLRRASTME